LIISAITISCFDGLVDGSSVAALSTMSLDVREYFP